MIVSALWARRSLLWPGLQCSGLTLSLSSVLITYRYFVSLKLGIVCFALDVSLPGRGLELRKFVLIYKEDGSGNLKQEIGVVHGKRKK